MGKTFVIHEGEREKIAPMAEEDLQKFLKGDKYDYLRRKAYHKDIREHEFIGALAQVEDTIKKLTEERTIPSTTCKPFEDRVIIFPDTEKVMTEGGIYIPEKLQNKPHKGVIIAVGPGIPTKLYLPDNVPMPYKLGDYVYYGKYAGTPIESEDGREILIMRLSDIFGLV